MKRILLAVLLFAIPTVIAYDEAEAPELRDDVVRVWHEPAIPAPGEQWVGFIEFKPGHNVTSARYQICNVGAACFNPPTMAQQVDANTWRFDTNEYVNANVPGSKPVPWGDADVFESWRVGVQYFLVENGVDDVPENWSALPHGEDLADDACDGRSLECIETHYLAWNMPSGEVAGKDSPGVFALIPLLGALLLRRR